MCAELQTITMAKMIPDDRRWTTPNAPAPLWSAQPRPLRPFHELMDMVHGRLVFTMKPIFPLCQSN